MAGPEDREPALGIGRRGLLGAGLAVALGGSIAARAHARTSAAGDPHQQSQPFHGPHQSGIVTPRPAAGLVASFHVLAGDPRDLERLLRRLTDRTRLLMAGGPVLEVDPRLPPLDSGIVGPVIAPDNLTVTVSLGASFFDERPWLAGLKPARLARMPRFPNDAIQAGVAHGDLCLQICANTSDTAIHALRDIVKNTTDQLVPRWMQHGNVAPARLDPDGSPQGARNFLGFRDGSTNPDATDAELMARIVWVGGDEPGWAAGGTYQAVRIVRTFVERWDRTPLREQEAIIGRLRGSGAPLSGGVERDVPDFAADPAGAVTPLDAHIRLANPRNPSSAANLMLRRSFNYTNGLTRSGQIDQGLLFICYQADLERGFIAVQRRLDGEPLEEYIKPVGGGFFFALPGVPDADDWLGRALVEAARRATPPI